MSQQYMHMENNYILDHMNIMGYMGSYTHGADCRDSLMHAVWPYECIFWTVHQNAVGPFLLDGSIRTHPSLTKYMLYRF